MLSWEFCKISKNTLFIEHLWKATSDFTCGIFFIFSIFKIFRLVESRFVRKKSTRGKPAQASWTFFSVARMK